jgi:hypothetical protein
MPPSGMTTLFTQRSDQGPQPLSFAFSVVVHGVAIAITWFAIAYRPPFTKVITEHYSVRKLDLHMPDMPQLAANARAPLPSARPAPRAPAPPAPPAPSAPAAAGSSAPAPVAPPQTAPAKPGPQTLVQPDLPKPVQLTQEIPLPQIVIWSPTNKVELKTVTPPQPQKPTSADVKPSVESPNQELNLANVNVASSFHPSPRNIVPPSTTSPVTVHSPQPQVQLPPVTASQSTLQPTPVQIMSLSDLRAGNQTVNLPPVNETKASNTQGALGQGQAQNSQVAQSSPNAKPEATGGGQNPAAKANDQGKGAGPNQAAKTNNEDAGSGQGPVAKVTSPGAGAGQGTNPSTNNTPGPAAPSGEAAPAHPGSGTNSDSDQNIVAGATLVAVPKDGHFSSVIVGDSLQDRYPEIGDVWSGRLTYTAYLHVGLAKSWILQYSLPRAADASHAGTVARLDAPWPYNIVRPNLEPGSVDADALMVHGFVNQSGRFETLSVLFPEDFPRAQFVLAALQQWQFRPAAQDGQPARVEVLLIIPQEYE